MPTRGGGACVAHVKKTHSQKGSDEDVKENDDEEQDLAMDVTQDRKEYSNVCEK